MPRRSRLAIVSGLSILAVLAASGGPTTMAQDAGPAGSVSNADARSRIESHDALIDKRYREMNARYAYGAAERTLKTIFQREGITQSLGYTSSWGNNGLWLAWEPAQVFYRYHRGALAESLNTVRGQTAVSGGDLAYLDDGMRAWREHDRQLELLFQQAVDAYLKRAINFDKKFAIQEKYRRLRAEAFAAKAFDRLGSLNSEEAQALEPLAREAGQLDETLVRLRRESDELSRKRLFEAIKAGPGPEVLVRGGKAPGANERESP
jgi:hypothetical protein